MATDTAERVAALKAKFYELTRAANEHFTEGKLSLAARDAGLAGQIANDLSGIERRLGNACSTYRLLEWAKP
jgi:hypothetical protein